MRNNITNLQFFVDDHFTDSAVHHRRRQIKHFSQGVQTRSKDNKQRLELTHWYTNHKYNG